MHTFLFLYNIFCVDYSILFILSTIHRHLFSFQFADIMNSGSKTILYVPFGKYMYNQIGFYSYFVSNDAPKNVNEGLYQLCA